MLRRRGAPQQADALESCADELEAALRQHEQEALTLQEASEESGYSYSALQKMVATGKLARVGNKHTPRVRRRDLPRKARQHLSDQLDGEPDLAARILASRG